MGNKAPQDTAVLIRRLRRVARWLDGYAAACSNLPGERARANTVWQAVARLEELAGQTAPPESEQS